MIESSQSYRISHQALNHWKNYNKSLYEWDTFSNRVWDLEKDILSNFLNINLIDNCLDFACWTWRVTKFLESKINNIIWLDISEEMLKEARLLCKKTKFIKWDLTNESFNVLWNSKFSLITAFRFFLNSEQNLREEVMIKLSNLLNNNWYLIFNIHGNKTSWVWLYWPFRKLFQPSWNYNLLNFSEVKDLIEKNNLKIIEHYSYWYLPFSHSLKRVFLFPFLHSYFLSSLRWKWIEKKIMTKNSKINLWSYMMFICKKNNSN